jgi:Leucine-rich repeat (LRR) protein
MKKFLSLLVSFMLLFSMAKAQYVNIPDTTFRNFLQQQYPSCFNASGMMDTTCSAIVNEKDLILPGPSSIQNLSGFQYFKSLRTFGIIEAPITSLPVLPNSLDTLICKYCTNLSSLPTLPGSLAYLDCSGDIIISLPALPGSLAYLECSGNYFSSLPALPNSLTYLDCSGMGFQTITSLPPLPASLTYLDCSANQITSLPAYQLYRPH